MFSIILIILLSSFCSIILKGRVVGSIGSLIVTVLNSGIALIIAMSLLFMDSALVISVVDI